MTLLPDVIARFVALYPRVRVDVDLGNRKVDLVAEGFDLALRASTGKERDSSLVRRRVMVVDLRFYASPTYVARRGSPREPWASDHDWIGFVHAGKHLTLPSGFEPRVESNDMLFIREATRAGVGIGLLPNFVADPLVASGTLTTILPRVRLASAGFVMLHPAGPVPRKVTAFREVLLARKTPWGCAEARTLGIYELLRDSCGLEVRFFDTYAEPMRRRRDLIEWYSDRFRDAVSANAVDRRWGDGTGGKAV